MTNTAKHTMSKDQTYADIRLMLERDDPKDFEIMVDYQWYPVVSKSVSDRRLVIKYRTPDGIRSKGVDDCDVYCFIPLIRKRVYNEKD